MNILRGMFRLSIVAAVVTGLWASWGVLQRHNKSLAEHYEMKFGYECGARLSDEELSRTVNQFQNINIGKLGCSTRDFFVSMDEIRAVRAGQFDQRFGSLIEPAFDGAITSAAAGSAFILVNLLGLLIVGAIAVYQWIARGFSKVQ